MARATPVIIAATVITTVIVVTVAPIVATATLAIVTRLWCYVFSEQNSWHQLIQPTLIGGGVDVGDSSRIKRLALTIAQIMPF